MTINRFRGAIALFTLSAISLFADRSILETSSASAATIFGGYECVQIGPDNSSCDREFATGAPYACDRDEKGKKYRECKGEAGEQANSGQTLYQSTQSIATDCVGKQYQCIEKTATGGNPVSYAWSAIADADCGARNTIKAVGVPPGVTPPPTPCPKPTPPSGGNPRK